MGALNAHQELRGVYDVRFMEWYGSKGDAWLSAAFTHGRVALLLLLTFTSIRQVRMRMSARGQNIY